METRRHFEFAALFIIGLMISSAAFDTWTVTEEQRYFNREFDLIVANYV